MCVVKVNRVEGALGVSKAIPRNSQTSSVPSTTSSVHNPPKAETIPHHDAQQLSGSGVESSSPEATQVHPGRNESIGCSPQPKDLSDSQDSCIRTSPPEGATLSGTEMSPQTSDTSCRENSVTPRPNTDSVDGTDAAGPDSSTHALYHITVGPAEGDSCTRSGSPSPPGRDGSSLKTMDMPHLTPEPADKVTISPLPPVLTQEMPSLTPADDGLADIPKSTAYAHQAAPVLQRETDRDQGDAPSCRLAETLAPETKQRPVLAGVGSGDCQDPAEGEAGFSPSGRPGHPLPPPAPLCTANHSHSASQPHRSACSLSPCPSQDPYAETRPVSWRTLDSQGPHPEPPSDFTHDHLPYSVWTGPQAESGPVTWPPLEPTALRGHQQLHDGKDVSHPGEQDVTDPEDGGSHVDEAEQRSTAGSSSSDSFDEDEEEAEDETENETRNSEWNGAGLEPAEVGAASVLVQVSTALIPPPLLRHPLAPCPVCEDHLQELASPSQETHRQSRTHSCQTAGCQRRR